LEDPVVGRRGRCLSRGHSSDYKENVTMNKQITELLDERSRVKMKRAKKFEKRIRSKKREKDYKPLSK
jgi:hypothetical protein